MAYSYHTQLLTSFFDKFIELLSVNGNNSVIIYNAENLVLVRCSFPNTDFIKSREGRELQLIATNGGLAELDGIAKKGAIFNGNGLKLVEFEVGSPTINPSAELKLNSVSIYKGGTVTINSITLTV